ncbi:MAG: hypothetical protein HOP11_12630 [Saprospiraceae bacterium]|nr:hypothetical protein [Saprospiraceae bacterium]
MKTRLLIIFFSIMLFPPLLFSQKAQQIGIGVLEFSFEDFNSKRMENYIPHSCSDTTYNPDIINVEGILVAGRENRFAIRESALVIGFLKNFNNDVIAEKNFEARAQVLIKFRRNFSLTAESKTVKFNINYSKEAGTNYKAKDYFILDNVMWAEIRLDSFYCSLPAEEMDSNLISLAYQIMGKSEIIPNSLERIAPMTNFGIILIENLNAITFRWKPELWAQAYDLEWKFLDDYSNETINFRNGSTRVNVNGNKVDYSIPMISTKGKIYFRIRPVGARKDGTTFKGKWSDAKSIAIAGVRVFMQDKMPWQYTANYAEDGLRKDIVSFSDGTGRVHQNITQLNSSGKHLLVQEIYYDHQGRPVVQSLPAPFKSSDKSDEITETSSRPRPGSRIESGNNLPRISDRFLPRDFVPSPIPSAGRGSIDLKFPFLDLYRYLHQPSDLSFIRSFNKNMEGNPYDRRSFDLDPESDECGEPSYAKAMNSSSGAGKYYGNTNDFEEIHSEYVPDAEGFPLMQIEYTPDNTGRVKRQSLAGKDFQLGSGHETKYYYAVPSQSELFRMFGHDAGDANKYIKLIKKDANGQLQISYQNSKGQIIANALAGVKPESLEELSEKEPPVRETINVIEQSNWIDENGDLSKAVQTFFIEQNSTSVTINYQYDPSSFNSKVCKQNICYDCPKLLRLKLSDACGQIKIDTSKIIGPLSDSGPALSICNPERRINFNYNLTLDQGEYYLEKYLEIIDSSRLKYVLNYVTKDTACFIPDLPPYVPCITTEYCIPCNYDMISGIPKRRTGNEPNCKIFCQGYLQSFDEDLYSSMLRDFIPGSGQYACVKSDTIEAFSISIFNERNLLFGGIHYRNPEIIYLDETGLPAWIDVSAASLDIYDDRSRELRREGDKIFARPNDIISLEYLKLIWKESWSEALVKYHPEFGYFEWNNLQLASIRFDKTMRDTMTYNGAIAVGFLREDAIINEAYVNRDPFFASTSDVNRTNFLNKLNTYVRPTDGSALSLYDVIRQSVFCNAPLYSDPAQLRTCLAKPEHSLNRLTDEGKNFAWNAFKGMYQGTKQKIIDTQREADLSSGSGHPLAGRIRHATCIGANEVTYCGTCSSSPSLLEVQLKKAHANVIHTRCIDETHIPSPDEGMPPFTSLAMAGDYARAKLILQCDVHPRAWDFKELLNMLVVDLGKPGNKLSASNINLNDVPPTVLPFSIVKNFPNKTSSRYYWNSTIDGNSLRVKIVDDRGVVQSEFKLTKTDTSSWTSIEYFGCITHLDSISKLSFTAFAKDTHRFSVVLLSATNINFSNRDRSEEFSRIIRSIDKTRHQILRTYTPKSSSLCCRNRLSPKYTPVNECERSSRALYAANVQRAKMQRAEFIFDSIFKAYTKVCVNPNHERLSIQKDIHVYHFTLFYYDQIGNLQKSVPPRAVNLMPDLSLASDRSIPKYAVHKEELSTHYKYNSLNAKTWKRTPDGGVTRWCYDEVGRNILSQDAVQASANEANYLIYDKRSRLVESGICFSMRGLNEHFASGKWNYLPYYSRIKSPTALKKEITTTVFDLPAITEVQSQFTNGKQKNLRSRISSILFTLEGTPSLSNYSHATHVSYNIGGQVSELIQDFKSLASNAQISTDLADKHRYKKVKYQIDQITGNVKETAYQPGKQDQFYHWFSYAADNRILDVETGSHRYELLLTRDRDAHYKYYLHGPAARFEIGEENIQGVDLLYTINGWLKATNNPNDADRDFGLEKSKGFLKDALSNEFKYYYKDYKPVRSDLGSSTLTVSTVNLFTGNISGVNTFNAGFNDTHLHHYKYDQLTRLVNSRRDIGNEFAMNLTYDKNGNIETLQRYDGRGRMFDNFDYSYNASNNQLLKIKDHSGQMFRGYPSPDLAPHRDGATNYSYDAKGRLLTDAAEGNMNLSWYGNDIVKMMRNDSATSWFTYDALGRIVYKHTGSGKGEFTVRDFTGNILAFYNIEDAQMKLNHFPIYATTRIGAVEMDTLLNDTYSNDRWSQYRGAKLYELKNQIGDLNVLITDRRVPVDAEYESDIRKATDYYPFGMVMPGRDSSSTSYRYGFQSMELDNNHKGQGNSYTTEFRQYDPRIGRWLSIDPMAEKYAFQSPYTAFNNNPIYYTDPKGDDVEDALENVSEATAEAATADANLAQAERVGNIRVGDRIHVLRYDIPAGVNRDYTVIAGAANIAGTAAPVPGRPGYDGAAQILIENGRINQRLIGLVGEVIRANFELHRAIVALTLEVADDINMDPRAQQMLTNYSHGLNGIHFAMISVDAVDDFISFREGAANLFARSETDLAGRIQDFSQMFDASVHFFGNIGVPIPSLLSDGFVQRYGNAVFCNALRVDRMFEELNREGSNCYNNGNDGTTYLRLGPGNYICIPGQTQTRLSPTVRQDIPIIPLRPGRGDRQ